MSMPMVDLDSIARQSIEPIEKFLKPSAQHSEQQQPLDRSQWKQSFQLINMTLPQVVRTPSIRKKFKIQFIVYDNVTKKSFTKTVYFGESGDYIFTKNQMTRLDKIRHLKHMNNPLHGDYWRAHICFSSPNWIQNVMKLVRHLLEKKGDILSHKHNKKESNDSVKKREASLKLRQYQK